MSLAYITIGGQLRGTIWQPGFDDCTKEFSVDFLPEGEGPYCLPWKGIKDALSYIVQDADFEFCTVDFAYIVFHFVSPKFRETKTLELKPGKATANLFYN